MALDQPPHNFFFAFLQVNRKSLERCRLFIQSECSLHQYTSSSFGIEQGIYHNRIYLSEQPSEEDSHLVDLRRLEAHQ